MDGSFDHSFQRCCCSSLSECVTWTLPVRVSIPGRYELIVPYSWEIISTFDFELDFIYGRKKFKWPLIVYFVSRYAMLGYLICQ